MDKSLGNLYWILAIDEEELLLPLIQFTLEQQGSFRVSTATSGEEALAIIKQQGIPHLAIVDFQMQGMSGFEFCEAVHEFSDLPIILSTDRTNDPRVVEGLKYTEDFVFKPLDAVELIARVERVLRRVDDYYRLALEPIVRIDDRLTVNNHPQRGWLGLMHLEGALLLI